MHPPTKGNVDPLKARAGNVCLWARAPARTHACMSERMYDCQSVCIYLFMYATVLSLLMGSEKPFCD